MAPRKFISRDRPGRMVTAFAVSAALLTPMAPPLASAAPSAPTENKDVVDSPRDGKDPYAFYDSRRAEPTAKRVLRDKAKTLAARPPAGVRKLRGELGPQGLLQLDPLTATPRNITKLNGFLTGPSDAPARSIATTYLRAHPDVFRLAAADINNLNLRKEYVDIGGTRHLSFTQSVDGVPVFGNGLKVNITKNGQIVNITGSVAPGLTMANLPATRITPDRARTLSASAVKSAPAPATARPAPSPAGATSYSNGDRVNPTVFVTGEDVRRGWQTLVWTTGGKLYQQIVDATTGKILYRQSLSQNDSAIVYGNSPGAPYGGKPVTQNLKPTWLPNNSPRLSGNVGHVYADVNDNNIADKSEEIPPSARGAFQYPIKPFPTAGSACGQYVCTWDPKKAGSWRDNVNQGASNVMYHVGEYHDSLAAGPIGFTREAGNFEAVDGDGLNAEVFDKAAVRNGNPSALNNADFGTPPDGQSPRLQMLPFLWPQSELPVFSGNEAGITYHEYTHGLAHRLITNAAGDSALNSEQSATMGEGWSDWYSLDYLTRQGMERDTAAPGELTFAPYATNGEGIRSEPIDCPVNATTPKCPGKLDSGPGGYTFGEYGRLYNNFGYQTQPHADGEIWSQTLWQLRASIGATKALSLVTRAMELAPESPSFLDMRNSILLADLAANQGRTQAAIWKVFASRGMGFFASFTAGYEDKPIEDFSLPPANGTPSGTITGTVTDKDTKKPVSGIRVGINGHDSGLPGDYTATSDSQGAYTIENVPPGTYPIFSATGDSYDSEPRIGFSLPSRRITTNWEVRRNWASVSGGASITNFNGADFTPFGCGPASLVDGSQSIAWVTALGLIDDKVVPRYVVIKFPKPTTVTELAIDPDAGCALDNTASTKDYQVETSADGTTWQAAATGTFTDADRGKRNPIALKPGSEKGVQFIKFTMILPQIPGDIMKTCRNAADMSGCTYMSAAELAVYSASN